MAQKSAQRQFLVKVSGVTGLWAQKQGGEVTSDVTKVWDGGSLVPDILTSPQDVTDITVTRPYDRARDQSVVNNLRRQVGRKNFTITVTATDRDLVATGRKEVFAGVLTRVRGVNVDAGSGDPADIELTFSIQRVTH